MKISDSVSITISHLPLDACPWIGFVHFMEIKWTESLFTKRFGDSSNNERTMTTWINESGEGVKKKCFKLGKRIKLRYNIFYSKQKKKKKKKTNERDEKSKERLMNIEHTWTKFNSVVYFHIFSILFKFVLCEHRAPNTKRKDLFIFLRAMQWSEFSVFYIVELVVWHPLVIMD